MTRVLLIHAGLIPHYRIPIYGYLSEDLERHGFSLSVVSDGIQDGHADAIGFPYIRMRLKTSSLVGLVRREGFEVIIDFMGLRNLYLFPTYAGLKGLLRRKMVYWGHGRDLLRPDSRVKNSLYWIEQALCDAIILYAEHLKKYVSPRFHKKVFIANNTLHIDYDGLPPGLTRESVLAEFGIRTKRNIICVGRMQRRKRVDHLVRAHALMDDPDIGLILAGPDQEGVLDAMKGPNIFKLGPVYGDKKFHLLSAADVYCLPGALGLSIVDAFHCGLPVVTEDGDESAETMYLKDGINGYIVPRGDIRAMSQKLLALLTDQDLRTRFSDAARREIRDNGNMDVFCRGFREALFHATGRARVPEDSGTSR